MSHPIESAMKDWKPLPKPDDVDGDMPYVTHEGVLELAGITLKCYRLSNGMAVIDEESMERFLGSFL